VDLGLLRQPNDAPVLGDDIRAMTAFLTDTDANLYNLYVVDPSEQQIWRYSPELGGSGFSEAGGYLASDNEDMGAVHDVFEANGSIYTLTSGNMVRHYSGRIQEFDLAELPDAGDMRPGHDYRLATELDDRLYVYDATWSRLIVFDRVTGDYVEQWATTGRVPPMEDLRGMYVVAANRRDNPPTVFWLTADGLYQSQLVDDPSGALVATPAPQVEPSEEPEKTPRRNRRTPAP
jgi:hypothetical protein